MTYRTAAAIEGRFAGLAQAIGRRGAVAFSAPEAVRLVPEQEAYLHQQLAGRPLSEWTAVSLALFYHPGEVLTIPATWQAQADPQGPWNQYARAYNQVNQALNGVSGALAADFGGLAELATIDGWAGAVGHVDEYYPHCISHRAFAEAAGLGWRGRHGLIVTPDAGPALRLATVFLPTRLQTPKVDLPGCGDCRACLDVCPILRRSRDYREACRRRIDALGLEADVCGICVRVCWERTVRPGVR